MGPCYLSPDDTDVRFLLGVRNGGLVLGLVHIGASLTDVPCGFVLIFCSFHLDEGGVLVLVGLPRRRISYRCTMRLRPYFLLL